MRRKRVTYRPNKAQSVFGGVVGLVFVGLGVGLAIPTFGLFGIFWTLIAVGITIFNFYQAFGKRYIGPEISIEEEDPAGGVPAENPSAARLRQLQSLYDQGLITEEEYEAKRQEILREL